MVLVRRSKEEWFSIAWRRILSVVGKNIACTERQLQMKISEAGPYNQRIEPLIITDVLSLMLHDGAIMRDYFTANSQPQKIYFLPHVDLSLLEKRKEALTGYYNTYYSISGNRLFCGNVLEHMMNQAVLATNLFIVFGNLFEDNLSNGMLEIASPSLNVYNGNHTKDPIDLILTHKRTLIGVGVEVKNKREWKYGSDKEIWHFIHKCCELKITPIFVARKIPVITKFFFQKAGILGMETQFQYIHPCKEPILKDIITKDKLAYADIKFETQYRGFFKSYFENVVDVHLEEYSNVFMKNIDILYDYSKILKLDKRDQHLTYKQAREEIYEAYGQTPEDEYDIDYNNDYD